MNECIMKFTDFCPKDRFYFIFLFLIVLFIGYLIGTDGHWKRFWWKEKDKLKEEMK